jgi:hypothetical protein
VELQAQAAQALYEARICALEDKCEELKKKSIGAERRRTAEAQGTQADVRALQRHLKSVEDKLDRVKADAVERAVLEAEAAALEEARARARVGEPYVTSTLNGVLLSGSEKKTAVDRVAGKVEKDKAPSSTKPTQAKTAKKTGRAIAKPTNAKATKASADDDVVYQLGKNDSSSSNPRKKPSLKKTHSASEPQPHSTYGHNYSTSAGGESGLARSKNGHAHAQIIVTEKEVEYIRAELESVLRESGKFLQRA